MAPTRVSSCDYGEFFFFLFNLCSTSDGCFYVYSKRKKRKVFKWKKRMKTVLELLIMKMQAQLCKYKNCSPFLFLLFFLQIFVLLIPACLLFVFLFRLTNLKISLVAFISTLRSRHWQSFCKTTVAQEMTKIVIFLFY